MDEKKNQTDRQNNRVTAADDFEMAKLAAARNGLTLKRQTDAHYQVSKNGAGWLLNIYPGNQRIYRDPNKPAAPHLDLQGVHEECRCWKLIDIVMAVAQATNGGVSHG